MEGFPGFEEQDKAGADERFQVLAAAVGCEEVITPVNNQVYKTLCTAKNGLRSLCNLTTCVLSLRAYSSAVRAGDS